uniref:Phytocyanin domain-containing protein n=1 Tax=Chenopodium quinoa TaxID=63459 RepID=A0A803LJZ5_CHEQI
MSHHQPYDDGNGQTVILLSQPGWRYFVCGRPHHCSMGLKLSVEVLYQHNPLDQTPQSNSAAAQPVQPGSTPTEGSGYGYHDKHDPHLSRGYSNLNAVNSSRAVELKNFCNGN